MPGGGVSIDGISLTANTSHSSSVTYTWKMDGNSSIPHYLFGASAWPAQSSGATIIYSN
ncbi:hypothetical protein KDL01_23480 [Actinospica durhamensis]|uniref:Uncharacterized protein n=1 Tax=Actinospica durhamensis TaxID=1508375 RepID=A0A941EWG5_9ACTN|nr:hypothetical protein [Actinospica durhamensis]MBR7836259.1 hypothetical protein [Actinospica durhamensis]